jgi:hypothetical protein
MENNKINSTNWKTWGIIAASGIAIISISAYIVQSKNAALGKKVSRNVTKFLVDNGSQINDGIISGGLVNVPMKTNIAVNSTVISLLGNYYDQMIKTPPSMQRPDQTPISDDIPTPSSRPRTHRDRNSPGDYTPVYDGGYKDPDVNEKIEIEAYDPNKI